MSETSFKRKELVYVRIDQDGKLIVVSCFNSHSEAYRCISLFEKNYPEEEGFVITIFIEDITGAVQ